MVKLIPGKRGSGKTKVLIDAIHNAEKKSKGNVVAIQLGSSLNHDVYHRIRLINIEDYKIKGCDDMHGFVAGLLASDYDCTDIFADGLLKIVGRDLNEVGKLLDRITEICDSTCVTFTISCDISEMPESVKKYLQ
jgi:Ni2+-binding GTPase involved in maturation of urease and hydrogenase